MKNSLFKSKFVILFVFLMMISCDNEVCPTDSPPEDNKLVLEMNVNKMYWGDSGASGEVNGEHEEYGMASFFLTPHNNLYAINIGKFVWYENELWAARELIGIYNLDLDAYENSDTIVLSKQPSNNIIDPFCRIYHLYLDGDAGAECYEIDDESGEKSWLLIRNYDRVNGFVSGELNLSMSISDNCPDKYDPNAPDNITIRNFRFRAKLRE